MDPEHAVANWMLGVTVQREGHTLFSARFRHVPVTIGAAPRNDVVLDDRYVSAEHARVVVSRGVPLFLDQSRNGSFVRGQRVTEYHLEHDDRVEIPPFELAFALTVPIGRDETLARVREKGTPRVAPSAPPRDAARISRLALRVTRGPGELLGRVFPLPNGAVTLGRGDEADIRLPLSTVSRVHVDMTVQAHGAIEVRDRQSSNGTFVDGQRVETATLTPGAEIGIGRELVLLVIEPPDSLDPTAAGATSPATTRASRGGPLPSRSPEASPAEGGTSQVPVVAVRARRADADPRVMVLELAGRVDGYTYSVVGDALDREIDRGERFLVLDLARVSFIDHAGLGVLVKALATLDERKGRLHLMGLGARLRDAFALSRLDSLFHGRLAKDEAAALAALTPHLSD